jgi:uncharacterized membrane protein YjjP (DUF1212 family)
MNRSPKIDFVLKLAKALHENGFPTHRLEDSLEELCLKIGLEADILSSLGSIFISFKENDSETTHLIKVKNSDLNLEKIDSLESLIYEIKKDKINLETGREKLEEIIKNKSQFSSLSISLFFAISTGSAASLFGGKLPEIICSFLIGLLIALVNTLGQIFPRISKIKVLISSIFAVLLSGFFSIIFKDFKQEIATICGLIILIPGFSFTVSITEIVNNHYVTGLSRLTGAFITFVMIAIGIVVGDELMKNFDFKIDNLSSIINNLTVNNLS